MDNYLRFDIETESAEQSEILIAELSEIKFYAFQQEENILNAYVEDVSFNEALFEKVLPKNLVTRRSVVPKINWNKKWENEFTPVIVDDFVAVRAAFHLPVKNVKHDIIITPKMSFGTGHHATTYLMLKEMEKINFKDKSVFDFGTGTGILSILAKKLGANMITSIDLDDWSIENAKENFKVNHCDDINLFRSDTISGFQKFDIILANINLNVIISGIENFKKISHKSILLLSGFLKADEKILIKEFNCYGFTCNAIKERDGWICAVLSS